jgi:hypothetical protein
VANSAQRSEEELRPGRPEPNWLEVHRDHKRGKHVSLQQLHLESKTAHPDGLIYTQFCVHYRRWLGRQDLVMRLEYAAGERMFVDFAGDTVPVIDPETGEVWDAQVFVSVLGASAGGVYDILAMPNDDAPRALEVERARDDGRLIMSFWSKYSQDGAGGFISQLNRDGTPYDVDTRHLVAASIRCQLLAEFAGV